jgi:CheY-like chemotaxis protein
LEAIGTLAGGLAHDLNNLLMTIQGNTSLILYETDTDNPHYESLTSIENAVKSGAKLTKQLLGYARKGKYVVRPINLNKVVEATSDTFGRARKEITLHLELAADLSLIVADENQIEQVLLNIFVNAADSMPEGGKVILKTINAAHEDMEGELYEPKPGKYVKLQIADTGVGMDEKTQEHIFEPFYTTKEMGRGKSHGGYINVDSEKGIGTTFTIFLPASTKKIRKTIITEDRIVKGSGVVLFVDDEEMVLRTGAQMLKKLGYTVLEANSGREAIAIYKEQCDKIDMLILDMIMPNMGGGEVYDKIKQINPEVKVLLSSGYSIDGKATEILNRGCDGFIQKPFSMKELSLKIKELQI